jgi:hypothetical protein
MSEMLARKDGLLKGMARSADEAQQARDRLMDAFERAIEFTAKIHPEWDDEDWLDHLYRVFPEAFRVGVLPDYWYELSRRRPMADKE